MYCTCTRCSLHACIAVLVTCVRARLCACVYVCACSVYMCAHGCVCAAYICARTAMCVRACVRARLCAGVQRVDRVCAYAVHIWYTTLRLVHMYIRAIVRVCRGTHILHTHTHTHTQARANIMTAPPSRPPLSVSFTVAHRRNRPYE
jgi:hypothetical protein